MVDYPPNPPVPLLWGGGLIFSYIKSTVRYMLLFLPLPLSRTPLVHFFHRGSISVCLSVLAHWGEEALGPGFKFSNTFICVFQNIEQ